MVRDIIRRDFLKGAGAADAADLTGLSGCIGSGGGGDGPEGLVVIGYSEDGIQLFRDYYSASGGSEEILVPDGMRSGLIPGQVGDSMANMTGAAPAAGGPNQDTFNQLFEDEYGAAPGAFTLQTYDSATIRLLLGAAAGENSGPATKGQMRRMANPDGMTVGPGNFAGGIEAAANGEDIDYQDASSSVSFDENSDPVEAAYSIWGFDTENNATSDVEMQSFAGGNSGGNSPSADNGPGDSDHEMSIGVLLPETGDLAAVGAPMIQTVQIPIIQVSGTNPAGPSVNTQIEDTQASPSSGVSAAQLLISAGVPSICGSASSGMNVPVSKQAFIPSEIVDYLPSPTALSVSNFEGSDFIFRTAPSDFPQGRVMVQVMAECFEVSSVSTLYVNNDYGQQLSERFSSVFSDSFDGEVYNQITSSIGESSYSSVIETTPSGPDN